MLISDTPHCLPSMMCRVSSGSSTICFESMLRDMAGNAKLDQPVAEPACGAVGTQ